MEEPARIPKYYLRKLSILFEGIFFFRGISIANKFFWKIQIRFTFGNIIQPEKGKPFEKVGRKVSGLSLQKG